MPADLPRSSCLSHPSHSRRPSWLQRSALERLIFAGLLVMALWALVGWATDQW